MKKYQIEFSAAALRDLSEIKNYITVTLENPSAAAKTLSKIHRRCSSLAIFPKAAPARRFSGKMLRSVHSGRYTIFYNIDETKRLVLIVSVIFSPHLK